MAKSRQRSTRPVLVLVATIAVVSITLTLLWAKSENLLNIGLSSFVLNDVQAPLAPSEPFMPPADNIEPLLDPWKAQVLHWVNGEPTDNFQDNLRPDMRYVTSWVSGGWTNDFMTYINMIYLGLLTARIPVMPPFAPSHVAYEAGFPHFGDVFDLPHLSAAIGAPLLEWRDIKREDSDVSDQLGCWSIWSFIEGSPRESLIPRYLNLDVSYTALPPRTERMTDPFSRLWLPFSSLADLSLPERRAQALSQHPTQTGSLEPDAHLLCFDFMYYIGAVRRDEWWEDWSPAWRVVGRHARWHPQLEQIVQGYVRRALDLDDDDDGDDYPPYIGVHIRRGDFTRTCGSNVSPSDCLAPLSAYARRVSQVLDALPMPVPHTHVLVTSDETDKAWWADVAALGWRRVDHAREGTAERLGAWYETLVDAVVQSRGVGFVGTDRSTMSLVARRRVEDWQGGVTYLVRMGRKGADD